MSRSYFDFTEVKEFQQKLQPLTEGAIDELCQEILVQLGTQFRSGVMKRTPVKTGILRKGWRLSPVVKKGEDGYEIHIYNDVLYASFVEKGHWHVHAWGTPIKPIWVVGRFFMEKEYLEMKDEVPKYVRQQVEKILKGLT